MSGGSYDYAYRQVRNAAETLRNRHPTESHVVALASHLERLAKVMQDIERADSGDTRWDETLDVRIREFVSPGDELREAREAALPVLEMLRAAIERTDPSHPAPRVSPGDAG